jgi:hypothetical protein
LLETTVVIGRAKHAKKASRFGGFALIFNEALNSAGAQDGANYQVFETVKKGRKTVRKAVHFRVTYDAPTHSVDIYLSGKPAFTDGGVLIVNAQGITDTAGDSLVGQNAFTILPRAKGIQG